MASLSYYHTSFALTSLLDISYPSGLKSENMCSNDVMGV